MLRRLATPIARRLVAAGTGLAVAATASSVAECKSEPGGLSVLRSTDFPLSSHYHGKQSVRVLRVRRETKLETVQEYTVKTRLYSPTYARVFKDEDNTDLVATDTQKNTVYVVAKKSKATTPEGFGVDLASHLLNEYPMLTAVEVEVVEDLWRRVIAADGQPHEHGFVREAPERATANVRLTREAPNSPVVVSGFAGLTVLKTTQSGFEAYLRDQYTMLPETTERCLATEMKVDWQYTPQAAASDKPIDYAGVRATLRSELLRGFFGPPIGGVYSASLQATIYDGGCMVLKACPVVQSISIFTPNIHMIPMKALSALGDKKGFEDDVYIATSEPSGTIKCTVSRS